MCASTALFVLAACASDSGQTGSPASEPPEYETPGRKPPEQPGGGTNGGVGETPDSPPEQVLPRPAPAPAPGSTALIGDRLLVAARGSLAVMDVTTPTAPSLLGRLPIEGDPGMLQARSLDRVIVSVYGAPHGASTQIPEVDVPSAQAELIEVDASAPAAPAIVRRDLVPEGSAGIVVREGGYTALGGTIEDGPATCAGAGGGTLLPDLPSQPKPIVSLWLSRFGADASTGDERREFGPGHWQLASDEAHAIRLGTPANASVSGDLEIEVVNLSSLETVYSVTVGSTALGTPASLQPSADFSGGVLVVAAGPRLLAFDAATGSPLLPVTTSSAIQGLRFLDDSTIGLDAAGSPLARLDRQSAAPALSLVPVSGGQFVGSLMPFGDGYLSLEGTGGGATPQLLRASSYRIDETGTLVLVDELQTDWYFSTNWNNGTPWHVDPESARISYVMPVDNGDEARIGVIRLAGSELQGSNLASVGRMPPAPLLHGDAVLPFSGGLLSPVRISEALTLEALPPTTLALDWVWFEVEHAGLIFARHRKDTGETYVSVRSGAFGEPLYLDVPHGVDALLPIDDGHLAVLGLAMWGLCDTLRETNPADFPECGPNNGNGVTILDIEGSDVGVGPTVELSSFMAGSPPQGVNRSLDWHGYLGVGPGKWALWGNLRDECTSDASCAALGVPAYRSMGSGGCSSNQVCDTGPIEFISGSSSASWLFVLDVTDPDAPVLEPAIREGEELRAGAEHYSDLRQWLLGYESSGGNIWAYPHQEYVPNAEGNWVDDGHGGNLSKWYLQLLETADGSVSFDERINVPGETVLLTPGTGSAEHIAYTLEPRYDDSDEQSMALDRVRIQNGGAFVEERLDLGKRLVATQPTEGFIAALTAPEEYCVEFTTYELRVADTRGATLALSQALPLPLPLSGVGWYLSGSPEPGVVELSGGPARFSGRLKVDVTADPPAIISYEY